LRFRKQVACTRGENVTTIDLNKCTKCGACVEECPSYTLASREDRTAWVRYPENCIHCGHCVAVCPVEAVSKVGLPDDMFTLLEGQASAGTVRGLLSSRRSIRTFQDRPVPHESLQELINCASRAGSASNAQSEGFIVIQDKKVLGELADLVVDRMWNTGLKYAGNSVGRLAIRAMYGTDFANQVKQYYRSFKLRKQLGDSIRVFWNAPALIVVHGLRSNILASTNSALAIRNIETMATPLGLGTCWAGFLIASAARSKEIARFLQLPAERNVFGALMLGYPKYRYRKTIPPVPRTVRWM
jgi:nitroreductase/NAD-dependent dihydropyrimidine dehydrogenase PreA subunit